MMMNDELIKRAKEAKSLDELLNLAKENEIPLDKEGAEEIFSQLHAEGEMGDEELASVSGGGCACYTKVGGEKYVIVTPGLDCFNGCFKFGFTVNYTFFDCDPGAAELTFKKKDHPGLRAYWAGPRNDLKKEACGNCYYLEFKGSTGYCSLSKK